MLPIQSAHVSKVERLWEDEHVQVFPRYWSPYGTLIALFGLRGSDLQDFKNQMEVSSSELSTTHVQIDEPTKHMKFHESVVEPNEREVQTYQEKIKDALKTLKCKGIDVRLESTKLPVKGIAR